ncbi:MAG: coenzyme A pyrophosphatase [Roseobacter sp. MedPE-SWde]|uniref:CoA pyrophosphatase n=1 Tax=Roseobacter sp. MED193 TaxID=314262 RepID=UPI000068C076|nr:CoA pyrophosphatase [Roseobacter sp. MED193]EAQ46307.1 hydrolase, NUDIX family protein [Roseobacter sp. MED193]OIQ41459.1 MAG: coenzyme A pyrophosphatase [Roseobacter sp. MedPE-SWde]
MTDLRQTLTAALAQQGMGSSDFDLNPDLAVPKDRRLRPAGVLVAISLVEEVPRVILTKRSSVLKHHPGQIAFPGGKVDEGDTDVTAAALREAWEEIGLPSELPEVIGLLPSHETVTSFQVTPVVALLNERFEIRPEAGEVAEVFSVPLAHVLDEKNYIVESRSWRGTRRHYYTVPFGPYYIWGATARMLRNLAGVMQ